MSLIGLKDLDFHLSYYLDNYTLFNLNRINKYYYNLFDDKYYNIRYKIKYLHLTNLNIINKKIFFENEKYLNVNYLNGYTKDVKNVKEGIHFAISNDRADLLFLIYHFNKLPKHNSEYDKLKMSYYPVELSIEKDSIECFKSLYKNIEEHYINLSIRNKSNLILKYLFPINKFNIDSKKIYLCFENNSPLFIELFLSKYKHFSQEIIEEVIYMITYSTHDIHKWIIKYNKAFHLFVSNLFNEEIKSIRQLALQRDRYHVIKLITTYTSPFSEFSKLL